eukprot:7384733-Prymnesium_polylepis.2
MLVRAPTCAHVGRAGVPACRATLGVLVRAGHTDTVECVDTPPALSPALQQGARRHVAWAVERMPHAGRRSDDRDEQLMVMHGHLGAKSPSAWPSPQR